MMTPISWKAQVRKRDCRPNSRRGIVRLCLILSAVFFATSALAAPARRAPARVGHGKRERRVYNLGGADILGKLAQPQALYMIKQAVFNLDVPKPQYDTTGWIEDSVWLDVFEP